MVSLYVSLFLMIFMWALIGMLCEGFWMALIMLVMRSLSGWLSNVVN